MSEDPTARLNAALEGRYRIERMLGEGGMATVYLADDLKHDRKVALKVLKPELGAIVGAERFLGEIKVTATLQHPNILPLFDSGEADKLLFYVMPHVEGESLRERLDREKQLPVDEAVKIVTDVAEALDHAHRKGVIHRDIKPANILLSDGRPLIADFGIALAVSVAGGGRLTETGLSVGTPYYMSPEQAAADREVNPASDVYSLACVLYEMLLGDPPHIGSSAQAVLAKILTDVPTAPQAIRTSIPANVDAAIRKALEKLPADRFTGAQEFARALAYAGFRHGGEDAEAVAVAVPGPWKRVAVTFAALFALSTLTLGWSLLRPAPPGPVARFPSPLREGQAPLPQGPMELTADGSALVYVGPGPSGTGQPRVLYSGGGGRDQLWIRRWDNLDATPVPGTEGAGGFHFVLSPDGREVAFATGQPGPLRVVALDGGPTRTLAEVARSVSGWTPDGTVYFSGRARGISRVRETGGATEVVTQPTEGEGNHGAFRLLPGGKMAVFQVSRVGSADAEIWAIDLETGDRRLLTPGNSPRYASTGHLLFGTADGTLMAAPIDEATAELTGPAVTVLGGLRPHAIFGHMKYSVSQTGTLVYGAGAAAVDHQLLVARLDGASDLLPLSPRDFGGPRWSPDGPRSRTPAAMGGAPTSTPTTWSWGLRPGSSRSRGTTLTQCGRPTGRRSRSAPNATERKHWTSS